MKKFLALGLTISASLGVSLMGSRGGPAESMSLPVCASSTSPWIPGPLADNSPISNGTSVCGVGSRGPGGGIIVYDAGELKWWGRYIEFRRVLAVAGVPWAPRGSTELPIYEGDAASVQRLRVDAKAVGMGATNTRAIVAKYGPGRYAASIVDEFRAGGHDDWFLPSKDELNLVYNYLAMTQHPDQVPDGPVWSSTEAWKNIAWYQLFEDGTQFSDSYILASKGGNKGRPINIKYPGTSFPSRSYQMYAVRAFPKGTGEVPPVSLPALTGNTCTNQGPCLVGDVGPAGGVVFYDAGTTKSWGRYLEVSPKSAEVIGWPWRKPGYDYQTDLVYPLDGDLARLARVKSKAIGMGAANTSAVVKAYGPGRYAAKYAADYAVNGYDDWFLPSADELDVMYNVLYAVEEPLSPFAPTYYWSSSEYDLKNAWTVLFRSGQRFDREGWFTAKDTGKPNAMRVRPIRAFG
ncbi:MAG: hypothetical protein KJS66_02145 [Acidobacteria bacterium]|nr:hypothetical protein [Acidobacteriota bacterium]